MDPVTQDLVISYLGGLAANFTTGVVSALLRKAKGRKREQLDDTLGALQRMKPLT